MTTAWGGSVSEPNYTLSLCTPLLLDVSSGAQAGSHVCA